MKRTLAAIVVLLAALVTAYSTLIAPHWLRVSRLRVGVPRLPDEWDGLRVSLLSDFHLGAPGMRTNHIHEARRLALEHQPDVIVLAGDFYDMGTRIPSEGLFADWPDGVPVFAVIGNHDRRPPDELPHTIAELLDGGVCVLQNEATRVSLRGREALIVAVDDAHTFNADVKKAFETVPAGETALLFLSHGPAPIRDITPGQASVMLSGHTHGGQVRLTPSGSVPLVRLIRKLRGAVERPDGPVYRRWHWINGTILIISDGLGVSTLPIRFRTRPHLVLIELTPASGDSHEACDDIRRYVHEIDPEPLLLRWLT